VHGLSGSTRWWLPTLPALTARHQVYLVDLPGFGAMARSGPFVLDEAAEWLCRWIDAVHLQGADLIGHSMGGYLSLLVAARRPDTIGRLILVDAAALPAGRSVAGHIVPLMRATRRMAPAFFPVLISDALRAGPRTLARAARDIVAADSRPYLGRVSAPTLIIWGSDDALVPLSVGLLLRQEIPDAQLLVLDGAGHVPMFERPAQFNRTVLAFLAGERVGT
jgi:pimeloyl-ACP methyl ester carboxylesterase